MSAPTYGQFIELVLRYLAATTEPSYTSERVLPK